MHLAKKFWNDEYYTWKGLIKTLNFTYITEDADPNQLNMFISYLNIYQTIVQTCHFIYSKRWFVGTACAKAGWRSTP